MLAVWASVCRATDGGFASGTTASATGLGIFDPTMMGVRTDEPKEEGAKSWTRSSGGPDTIGENTGEP